MKTIEFERMNDEQVKRVGYKQYTYVAINLENGIMLLDKLTSYLSIKHMIDMYL